MRQQLSKAAARRIWGEVKQHIGQGGFLLFDERGNGGWWYSYGSTPRMLQSDIRIDCDDYSGLTVEEVRDKIQRWLDDRAIVRGEA